MRKIKVLDVDEVINVPKDFKIKNDEKKEEVVVAYWPVNAKTVLENIDDARFKSKQEALK